MLKLKNTRYYKWTDDEDIEEFRIIKMQNEDTCSVLYTKGRHKGVRAKRTVDEIEKEYTMLRPDGFISFDIVTVGKNLKDVMIIVTRQRDMLAKEKTPYVVCRQCVVDLFAKQFSPDNIDYAGLSISKESCPADVKFENFLACESVDVDESISYYIGDKLDDILGLLRYTNKFDSVLTTLFNNHCDYVANNNEYISKVYKQTKEEIDGYYKTLKDLLYWNNFEYDIYRAFNIIPLTASAEEIIYLDESNHRYILSANGIQILSSILCVNIYESVVLEYDKDIELDKIKGPNTLIATNDGKVYLVAYRYNDNYQIPIQDIESEENIEKLNKIIPSGSIQRAYEYLQFNQGKYKS